MKKYVLNCGAKTGRHLAVDKAGTYPSSLRYGARILIGELEMIIGVNWNCTVILIDTAFR